MIISIKSTLSHSLTTAAYALLPSTFLTRGKRRNMIVTCITQDVISVQSLCNSTAVILQRDIRKYYSNY